jgi:hypothetical protein
VDISQAGGETAARHKQVLLLEAQGRLVSSGAWVLSGAVGCTRARTTSHSEFSDRAMGRFEGGASGLD